MRHSGLQYYNTATDIATITAALIATATAASDLLLILLMLLLLVLLLLIDLCACSFFARTNFEIGLWAAEQARKELD
jgi:hypothetical protein